MFKEIVIQEGRLRLEGHISSEFHTRAWVIFAHGSGSSRKSPRNNWVAQELNKKGYSTFLFDLLTESEDSIYQNRFNIPLLADRLLLATQWLVKSEYYHGEPIAYFGASTGAGAALIAAANASPDWPLFTVISRGGRPDLAENEVLNKISVPVLLIVGGLDGEVITLNEMAKAQLKNSELILIEGATHLFEEPGTLNQVVDKVVAWLNFHLPQKNEEETWNRRQDTYSKTGRMQEGDWQTH